jgi:VWFA-related protein
MRQTLLYILLSAFIFALPVARAQQQDPPKKPDPDDQVISMETNLVVLNVTVTDGSSNYVSGLTAKDFTILEDNAKQKILSLSYDETPFAAAILIDASGSMERKMSFARAACGNFVDRIRGGDVVSIYSFSGTRVRMLQDFSEERFVHDAVWDLRAHGETPLYDAIVKASDALSKREERRRAILIVSDNVDTKSGATLDDAVRKALGAQASIYGVDLSDAAVYRTSPRDNGAEVMKMLAMKTGGRFFPAAGGDRLRDAFSETVEELRQQYTLTYESSNEKFDGKWRAISVNVARPALTTRTRQGYYARKK